MTNSSTTDRLKEYKETNYERARIRLTSPLLHIGVGAANALNIFEYIQDSDSIYFPNQSALIQAIRNPKKTKQSQPSRAWERPTNMNNSTIGKFLEEYQQLLQEYIDFLEGRSSANYNYHYFIIEILKKLKKIYVKFLGREWLNNSDIFINTNISKNQVDRNRIILENISPMIRNGRGEIYIPGSSIKGAIRTAVAYYLLKYNSVSKISEIEQKLRAMKDKFIEDEKANLDDLDKRNGLIEVSRNRNISLNGYLFSNFRILDDGRTHGDPFTPNTDLMRAIKITDTNSLVTDRKSKINRSIVTQVTPSSFTLDNDRRTVKLHRESYLEMVRNLETEFTICIDTAMLDRFQGEQGIQIPDELKSVEGILKICGEFARAQWEYERNYWNSINSDGKNDFSSTRDFYFRACTYNFRLGWGTGMMGTTIGLHLTEQTRSRLRNLCGKSTNIAETPKSRRTALIPDRNRENSIRHPLGWSTLEIINEQE